MTVEGPLPTTTICVHVGQHGSHHIAYSDDLIGLNLIGSRKGDVLNHYL